METVSKSRRNFFATLISLPFAMAALWRFLTPKKTAKPALLYAPVADIPVGGALVYKQERIAVIRDGEVCTAISLVCTHLGCTVSVNPGGMSCPCHGSSFDRHGNVLTGPAERQLARLSVEKDGDTLVVRG